MFTCTWPEWPCDELDECECPCDLTVGVPVGALVVLTVGVVVDAVVEVVVDVVPVPEHGPGVSPCAKCAFNAGIAIVIVTWWW